VRNVCVAAREWEGGVVFLRKLQPGGASRSFGIEVAKIAGLPPEVLQRARGILAALEAGATEATEGVPRSAVPAEPAASQMGIRFPSAKPDAHRRAAPAPRAARDASEVIDRLRALDPDGLTPRQALDLIAEFKKKLTGSDTDSG
jgi:DNA mismatch repair protein MutS